MHPFVLANRWLTQGTTDCNDLYRRTEVIYQEKDYATYRDAALLAAILAAANRERQATFLVEAAYAARLLGGRADVEESERLLRLASNFSLNLSSQNPRRARLQELIRYHTCQVDVALGRFIKAADEYAAQAERCDPAGETTMAALNRFLALVYRIQARIVRGGAAGDPQELWGKLVAARDSLERIWGNDPQMRLAWQANVYLWWLPLLAWVVKGEKPAKPVFTEIAALPDEIRPSYAVGGDIFRAITLLKADPAEAIKILDRDPADLRAMTDRWGLAQYVKGLAYQAQGDAETSHRVFSQLVEQEGELIGIALPVYLAKQALQRLSRAG